MCRAEKLIETKYIMKSMESLSCPNCGSETEKGMNYCKHCGYRLIQEGINSTISKKFNAHLGQNKSHVDSTFLTPDLASHFPNIKHTEHSVVWHRITRILRFDRHAILSIKYSERLNHEAKAMFFLTMGLMTIFRLSSIFLHGSYKVESILGTIVFVPVSLFGLNFLYISLIDKLYSQNTKSDQLNDTRPIRRALSYAFVASAITDLIYLLIPYFDLFFLWVLCLIYSIINFMFVCYVALEQPLPFSLAIVFFAWVVKRVTLMILIWIINFLFGGTYSSAFFQ